MKYILASLIIFSNCVKAQKVFEKHNIHVSAGYGIGNVFKEHLKDAITYSVDYKVHSKGPFCLSVDYALLKNVSVGIAAGYSITRGGVDINGFKFDEELKAFSILARANYHLVKWKRFDPYGGGGIGYYHFKYTSYPVVNPSGRVPGNFGYSAQLGLRYFVTPGIAAYGELGYIGGSIAQLGATFKLK